jgi:ABC-type transport system involved in Fe-S cluster assembly fused permease/ATPase subunit
VVTDSRERLDATHVVIGHLLSTLVDAHRIIHFDGGQIQEEGAHAGLMAKGGLFALMAQRQMA